MAKLILSLDGIVLKEQELTKERTTIGRRPHNDIQIDNLAVSGEHAVIVTILNDSFLEDTGSTNGTLVNGGSVKKHFLQNGDVVEIGKYKLKYINEVASNTTAADFEKTMVLRAPMAALKAHAPVKNMSDTQLEMQSMGTRVENGVVTSLNRQAAVGGSNAAAAYAPAATVGLAARSSPPTAKADVSETALPGTPRTADRVHSGAVSPSSPGAAPSTVNPVAPPLQAGTALPLAAIQILTGPCAGRELELAKSLTTVGKPGVQVAVITRRPQGYYVTHVEGSSFPILNGKSLDVQARPLNDHDIVELAGVKMEFFLKG
jgi:pSer/pThr/pTyr-binding forkhead associated (FHA) protein